MAQFSVKIISLTGSVLGENQQVYGNPGPEIDKGFVWFAAGVAMALIAEIAMNSRKAG